MVAATIAEKTVTPTVVSHVAKATYPRACAPGFIGGIAAALAETVTFVTISITDFGNAMGIVMSLVQVITRPTVTA